MAGEGQSSLWDLYIGEVESHGRALEHGLLALERDPAAVDDAASLMRSAHSLKGAARVVRHDAAVAIAHAMEDSLVAVQGGRLSVSSELVQCLLDGVDLVRHLSPVDEADRGRLVEEARPRMSDWRQTLTRLTTGPGDVARGIASPAAEPSQAAPATAPAPPRSEVAAPASVSLAAATSSGDEAERLLRVSALTLNRVVALGSELVVASRWVEPFADEFSQLKRRVAEAAAALDQLELALEAAGVSDALTSPLDRAQGELERVRGVLAEQSAAFERRSQRQFAAVERLNQEVQAAKFRPFGEVVEALPRLARDLARDLGKRIAVRVEGETTGIDRDVAALLDAPLIHMVRNAVDHGIEAPHVREAAGKPAEGTIWLRATQRAGRLFLEVADDGRGVDPDAIRALIVERGHVRPELADRLTEQELLRFLFLPGFSTAASITEISGRGVGLDVLQNALQRAGGVMRIDNQPGRGLRFVIELPVTLSVQRVLLVVVGGETCGVPLSRVSRVVRLEPGDIEGEPGEWRVRGEAAGAGDRVVRVADARTLLGFGVPRDGAPDGMALLLASGPDEAALVIDELLGEQALAIRPVPAWLGRIQGVDAAAVGDDGAPVLLLDVDDLLRVGRASVARTEAPSSRPAGATRSRRVLVVEDSATVRELERQILEQHGYEVTTAEDGLEGWAALRAAPFDLVVSDVDMPRLDGLSLVRRMRQHPQLASVPVVMVSYRDRDEDRARGLAAGASAYLSKGSFHDDTFMAAIGRLLGGREVEESR